MINALEVAGLAKAYRDFALRDVSFVLPCGYIMGLIGANGAGKTTTLKAILGLVQRDAGTIRVFGQDPRVDEVETKRRIGFVHDVPTFYDFLSLERLARILAPFYNTWDGARFRALAERFELPLDRRFRALSRGTKMKFALAVALSHEADLLIMDEPCAGLDPVFRREFLDLLAEILQQESKSVLFSTQITSDLERVADYVTYLRAGRVVFSTTRDELRERWGIVKGGRELLEPAAAPYLRAIRVGELGVEALTDDLRGAGKALAGRALVEPASLEEIMVLLETGTTSEVGAGGAAAAVREMGGQSC